MRGRLVLGAALLIGLLMAVVACGDGDEEGAASPSPGATATPSAAEQQLQGMVLQLGDLPLGFSLTHESFSTNGDVAGGSADPQAELAQLTRWGRILGRAVAYAPGASSDASGVVSVDSAASLYQTDSGAAQSFADAVSTARATDWQANTGEVQNVQVEEIPPLDVADEMLWLRMSGTATIGDPPSEQIFVQDIVLMRVGRARGSLTIVSSGTSAAEAVESMVRAQAANMAAGLR